MPGIAAALFVNAPPGEEMTCLAKNRTFATETGPAERGVVSFYALQALATSDSVEDWSSHTTSLCTADVAAGRLPPSFAFSTVAVHAHSSLLPGAPATR